MSTAQRGVTVQVQLLRCGCAEEQRCNATRAPLRQHHRVASMDHDAQDPVGNHLQQKDSTHSFNSSQQRTTSAMTYRSKNWASIVLAAAIFGASIASLVVQWYRETNTFTRNIAPTSTTTNVNVPTSGTATYSMNTTTVAYTLEGIKTQVSVISDPTTLRQNIVESYTTFDSNSGGFVRGYFKTSQAFVVIVLVVSFVLTVLLTLFQLDRVRNWFIFSVGMSFTRIAITLLAALVLLSSVIAFLSFLGLPSAFKEEIPNCVDGPCREFSSSTKFADLIETQGVNTYTLVNTRSWGPVEGWFIVLGIIPVSVVLLALIVLNKFPLPIDSEASSGEAL
jgi:hypothetical protein